MFLPINESIVVWSWFGVNDGGGWTGIIRGIPFDVSLDGTIRGVIISVLVRISDVWVDDEDELLDWLITALSLSSCIDIFTHLPSPIGTTGAFGAISSYDL